MTVFCFEAFGCCNAVGGGKMGKANLESPNIFLYGTPNYIKKLSELKLTPYQAAVKIIEWRQSSIDDTSVVVRYPGENHYLLVGNDFVFSRYEKNGIQLSGIYVNGITGEVDEKKFDDSDILTPSKQKRLWGKIASRKDCYIYNPIKKE
jgi:hypothetical protein